MDLALFEKSVADRLSEKRMRHTLGCVETAAELAEIWGEDTQLARAAAMLHDITKEVPYSEQLKFCEKHGIIICNTYKYAPELIHAVTGAKTAELEFGVCDRVCSAIRWHTTGRADMTLLEKIIWLSDLTEPGRSFDGVEEIRSTARRDIDRAVIDGMERTMKYLMEKGQIIDTAMLEARNFLVSGGV